MLLLHFAWRRYFYSQTSLTLPRSLPPPSLFRARAHVAGHEVGCVHVGFPEIGSFPREDSSRKIGPKSASSDGSHSKLTLLLLLVHRAAAAAEGERDLGDILNTVGDPRLLCMRSSRKLDSSRNFFFCTDCCGCRRSLARLEVGVELLVQLLGARGRRPLAAAASPATAPAAAGGAGASAGRLAPR